MKFLYDGQTLGERSVLECIKKSGFSNPQKTLKRVVDFLTKYQDGEYHLNKKEIKILKD